MKVWEAAYIAGIIDGEGSITLTRMHKRENRRPCISISSNDKEMLLYLQTIAGGEFTRKRIIIQENIKIHIPYILKRK